MNTEDIGQRIKKKRKELGLTQLEIRELAGISSGNLSDLENGKKTPSAQTLIALSKVLQCSIDWILTGYSNDDEKIVLTDKREISIVKGFRKLDKKGKEEFIGILNVKLHISKK